MLYDIPIRSEKIETETILELAHNLKNVVALKDAAGDPSETASLLSQSPDGFEIYSGDDSLNLALLSIGASGVVGVATHWTGVEHQTWRTQSQAETTKQQRKSINLCKILMPSNQLLMHLTLFPRK